MTTEILTLESALRALEVEVPAGASEEQLHHMLCVEHEVLGLCLQSAGTLTFQSAAMQRVRERIRVERTMIASVLRAHGLMLYKPDVAA